jgi:hypothetical protein
MARIRAVKPEVRRSLTVAAWPFEVRLAWIYLWNYLDDAGRGLDDMRLIVAECFPLDRNVTERKMDAWLQLMATTTTAEDDEPALCRYEINGRKYLHAPKWRQHQKINRPQPSRLPQCPHHDHSLSDSLNHSLNPTVNGTVNGAVNGSLSDSLPSRAPADQGSGNREQGRDQGAETPPSRYCDDHPEGTRGPCTACGRARQAREAFDRARADTDHGRHRAERLADYDARRQCQLCDDHGYRRLPDGTTGQVCNHQPLNAGGLQRALDQLKAEAIDATA